MQFGPLKRREFIALLGGAASRCAGAAERLPLVGYVHGGSPEERAHEAAFRQDLAGAGYVDSQNVTNGPPIGVDQSQESLL